MNYEKFIRNEIKTLGFLDGFSTINGSLGNLSSNANLFYHQYKAKEADKLIFKFSADFNLIIEKRERIIIIEALLHPNFSLASYVFSICNKAQDDGMVLRKFHFDYAPNEANAIVKKPIYHLQYGGKATPRMLELQVADESIHTWLSSPRINTNPVNLALFLDMIFCEFRSDQTIAITERAEWRNLIKENEDLITKLYFERITGFFNVNHSSSLLFRDFCYGE
ncbi:hypothetical protein [Flagellimonas sp.]|uniref:hypothetical protein n=1 Tax=Flagellimonas sp. TaxID=2058762 RepID=UPI003B512A57